MDGGDRARTRPDVVGFYLPLLRGVHVARHVLALHMVLLLMTLMLVWAERLPFGQARYLTFITASTIAYGDIVPVTAVGRIASVVIGLLGLILFGMIVAIANNALLHTIEDADGRRRQSLRDTGG